MLLEVNVPFIHSVVKSHQSISSIWYIGNNKNEVFKLSRDWSALAIVLKDSNVIPNIHWVYLRKDGCPGITLFYLATVPELIVLSWKVLSELNLVQFFLINFCFIEAYDIGVRRIQELLQRLFCELSVDSIDVPHPYVRSAVLERSLGTMVVSVLVTLG